MKKLFISLMAVLFSAYVVAADSAIARITITGTTSGGSAQITLIENPSYSAGYDNGYDAPCNINLAEDLPKTLHIYSYIGANKYSTIATNNLDGLHVDFITNLLDDEYTMTFEVFTLAPGRTLDIYDLDENQRTDIDPSESYTFNATSGHNEITDRFVINYVAPSPYSVTTNAYGFCSFASASAVTLPAGLKAYKGDFNIDDYSIALSYIGQVVPANEGVILWNPNESAETFYYTVGGSAPAVSGNDFVGAVVAKPVNEIVAAAIYCLHGNELQKYIGTEDIPAGKAYLPIPSGSAAPQRVRMVFHETEQTEAVSNVEATVKAVKFVENGQIYIRRGNEVFNLQGQIVK